MLIEVVIWTSLCQSQDMSSSLGGRVISWSIKKQDCITLLTMKAKDATYLAT